MQVTSSMAQVYAAFQGADDDGGSSGRPRSYAESIQRNRQVGVPMAKLPAELNPRRAIRWIETYAYDIWLLLFPGSLSSMDTKSPRHFSEQRQ